MPYAGIEVTEDGLTRGQKAELIRGVTKLPQDVLDKNPETTCVLTEEVEADDWGGGGEPFFKTTLQVRTSRPAR